MTGVDAIAIIILLTILIAVSVYLLHWLYRHSSKDQSFVRTGFLGERVVMGGGALVIPIVHDITVVNMNVVPVNIRGSGQQSFITKNKMRVDLEAEFFVRVIPTKEGVSAAARSLGERTRDPVAMKELVGGRFIDAMSAVAATMTMEEIHVSRAQYIRNVADVAAKTLDRNGLELENASLIGLNQTDISVFNPSNAFDAEGLTQLTEQIEDRRKLRNKIENDARIDIKLRDFEAEQRALEIDRDLEYARLEQTLNLEIRKAEQLAGIEGERARSQISVNSARVQAEQEVERSRIAKDLQIETDRIASAGELRNREIEREKATEIAEIASQNEIETQRILTREKVDTDRIESEKKVRTFDIQSRHDIAIAETNSTAEIDQAKLESERVVEEIRIETQKTLELMSVDRDKVLRITNEVAAGESERAAIQTRYKVDTERLKIDEDFVSLEIAKNQKIKLAETLAFRKTEDAAVTAGREIEQLRVAASKAIEKYEIEQQMQIELTDKERLIAVINKSIEEAVRKTEAAEVTKRLVLVEEQVTTTRAEESANRAKLVESLDAESKANREAIRLTTIATAEKEVAEQRAQGEIASSNAAKVRYATDAAGTKLINESENMRSEESRRSAIYENLVAQLPEIIRETVKPMENIESIKILQVDGLPGINSPSETGGAGGGGGGGNISDQVVNSAMKYRTQVAFVDGLMKDIGLPLENLGSAGGMSFRNFASGPEKKGDKDD